MADKNDIKMLHIVSY